MKRKIWQLTVVMLLVGSLILTACGRQAPPTKAPTSEPVASATEPAVQPVDELVTIAGTIQAQLGCPGDWQPECKNTALTYDAGKQVWSATYDLSAGSYEVKVTIGGSWDINYGVNGEANGDNIRFGLSQDAAVSFSYNPANHTLEVSSAALAAYVAPEPPPAADVTFTQIVLPGTFQAQLGCGNDWMPDCEKTALMFDAAGNVWTGTFNIKKGSYEYKVAANGGWDINFGKAGAPGGDNLTLSLAQDAPVTFTFNPATNLVAVESEGIKSALPAASAKGSLVIWADQTRVPALRALADDFKAKYSIEIVVEELGLGDVRDIFTVAAPAGEGPDIIVGAHDWLGELVASGLLAPIDLGSKAADFAPAALEAFTYQGEVYGMPTAVENVAFFRNTDLVPEAPKTWDEVVATSRRLAANNDKNLDTNKYGFVRMESDPYHFFPIQTAFGGYVFGQNTDNTWNPSDVGMDSKGSIAAAQWYADYIAEGLQPPDMDDETMVAWFEQGKAAMIITGPWHLPRIKASGVNFAISSIPKQAQDGQPFLGVQGFMVNAFSKEPLLAQVFLIEFVATADTMRAIYDSQPRPPAFLPFLKTLSDSDLAAFAVAGANGVPMPAIPEMSAVWEAWANALTLTAQAGDTPQSAFTNAARQIRDAISKSR